MEQEFKKLIQDYHRLIYKVCRMYRGPVSDTQDLYQDILVQLWRAFPSFRKESKVSTWIYRIAINTCISQYRKNRNKPIHEGINEAIAQTVSNPENRNDELDQLNQAIALLGDIEKAIILLYLEEYSYKEIAEVIGITESNVGFKINQIKKKLKEKLG